MKKKILICCIFFSNLIGMDMPFEWGKRIIAAVSPRKKTQDSSPRTQNPTNQDCVALSHLATEIDILYRTSKETIQRERVENAYVKAMRCFVQTYEENPTATKMHLQKLLVLFLELQMEQKKEKSGFIMPAAYEEICSKAQHLLKRVIG